MKRVLPLLILLLAACGGAGNAVQNDATTAGNASVEAPSAANSSDEHLKNLKRLAAEAKRKFPELTNYEKLTADARGEHDGGEAMLKAVEAVTDLSYQNGDEPWRRMLAFGPKSLETGRKRPPSDAELQEALDQSDRVAQALNELREYDTIFVFGLAEGDVWKNYAAFQYLTYGLSRVGMLLALDRAATAAKEQACFFEVLSKIDWKVCPTAANRKSIFTRVHLAHMSTGEYSPLESDPNVVRAVELLRDEPVEGFKRSWRLLLADWVARINRAQTPEDIWASTKPDSHGHEWLDFLMKTAEEFPDHAPNPYILDEYNRAKKLAADAGGRRMEEDFASHVLWNLEERQAWLAWDLLQSDLAQPLLDRKDQATKMIQAVPYIAAEWGEADLTISITADSPFLADARRSASTNPITIKLRPKTR